MTMAIVSVSNRYQNDCFIQYSRKQFIIIKGIIDGLKKRKARDNEEWNNEMLIDGGDEMVLSLVKMFNAVMKEYVVPEPWENMTVKSTHKNGEKVDLTNQLRF